MSETISEVIKRRRLSIVIPREIITIVAVQHTMWTISHLTVFKKPYYNKSVLEVFTERAFHHVSELVLAFLFLYTKNKSSSLMLFIFCEAVWRVVIACLCNSESSLQTGNKLAVETSWWLRWIWSGTQPAWQRCRRKKEKRRNC